ncbi:MAG: hypothetical protein PHP65_05385 [Bacilli bacterium]|jgi:response regulator RpfG family c-di-GMP phosphodiesterase|nr:hypothetical protein [Bacilli bacterium]
MRSYKGPITHEEAMDIIYRDAGEHVDSGLVEVLKGKESQFRRIYDSMNE